jgi:ubiquinone/menaquinone biosynthesis C-methylase UbiE
MGDNQIRFDDGAAYERMMGVWSRLVGEEFIDWLAPATGLRWIDVGCGNGAFTELLVERCAPSEIVGVDPSEGQLVFARSRHQAGIAKFLQGDATALPFDDHSFDASVMALVIFFVPEPAKGLAEMVRVVRPGGSISAYVWDVLEPGGFPIGYPALAPAKRRSVANECASFVMAWRWPYRCRDARDHGISHLRGLRRLLGLGRDRYRYDPGHPRNER